MVGVASWMGESAGDAVQVLVVVVPTLVVGGIWGVLSRGTLRERLRAVLGLAVGLGTARASVDLPWILRHTQGYILSEAAGGRQNAGFVAFLGKVPGVLGENLVDGYAETLVWSLLTPVGAAVVGLGVLAGLIGRQWAVVLWALVGPMSLLVVLSMPEKTGDYYLLAAVPGLVMAAAVGLASLRRAGMMVLLGGGIPLASVLLTVVHLDLPFTHRFVCNPVGALGLLQDPMACASVDPHPKIRPTLRIAREIAGAPEAKRMAVAQWLTGPHMESVLAQIPSDSVIWVVGMGQSPVDIAEVVMLTQRSDVLVRRVAVEAHPWQSRADLDATEEWVLLLGGLRSTPLQASSWPAYMGDVLDHGGTGYVRVGQIRTR